MGGADRWREGGTSEQNHCLCEQRQPCQLTTITPNTMTVVTPPLTDILPLHQCPIQHLTTTSQSPHNLFTTTKHVSPTDCTYPQYTVSTVRLHQHSLVHGSHHRTTCPTHCQKQHSTTASQSPHHSYHHHYTCPLLYSHAAPTHAVYTVYTVKVQPPGVQ